MSVQTLSDWLIWISRNVGCTVSELLEQRWLRRMPNAPIGPAIAELMTHENMEHQLDKQPSNKAVGADGFQIEALKALPRHIQMMFIYTLREVVLVR